MERLSSFVANASAFSVHIFTASGAAAGLIALLEATRDHWLAMFAWLGIALFIDGIDGTLARKYHVAERLPQWSGEALDFVVDFITYVFVPAYAIVASRMLTPGADILAGAGIVISGALYFADTRMKTDDYYFRGFPALWNLAAFYLFLLHPSPWIATVVIFTLIALTFVPIRVIHPMRVVIARQFNIVMLFVWGVLSAYSLIRAFDVSISIKFILCAIGFYIILGDTILRPFYREEK